MENIKLSELINKTMLSDIRFLIIEKLNRINIPVYQVDFEFVNIRGIEYIKIKTNKFNTTPSIYKSIFVKGFSDIISREERELDNGKSYFIKLSFSLDYKFELYDGGNNGVKIGNINFEIISNKHVRCVGLTIV